ncbi:MAG TPA: L-erythro-3,5-diaminohexanoate dehydrogenase [bacterium]|nr:L-erythro-3,5-diaminohexanoate dehydrogenase [bacterium]
MRSGGDHYGIHRVLAPPGAFPQAAERLDVSLPIYADEILIRVDRLNLDSASFRQLKDAAHGDLRAMAREIHQIVRSRGKMHNPATNSGGTLLGSVEEVGPLAEKKGFRKGERIATLVSLTLTPLHLDGVEGIDLDKEQVSVQGHAILFESGIAHRLPPDFPEPLALAVFDVCGAPAWIPQLVKVGETVVVFGAGKAGVLAAAEARKKTGKGGHVFLLEKDAAAVAAARRLTFADAVLEADLLDARQTLRLVSQATGARMADLVVNCVNVPGTEMATILAAKRSGAALFFNMATRFQAAVLGAEGIGHETRLIMGNGYYPGHADLALNLVREFPDLREWFEARFGA